MRKLHAVYPPFRVRRLIYLATRNRYLIWYSNDAGEQVNDDLYSVVHRQSPHFGSVVFGTGGRKATKVEHVARYSLRKIVYASRLDKKILADYKAEMAVKLQSAIARLLRNRMQYRRTECEARRQQSKRRKTTDRRNTDLTRHGQQPFRDITNTI